ncbi:uncharacterized protein LOC132200209 [Neocloeon triangulifer]|uniref:uncharacterized protein LOC132200209 n=1 Tax=Neocloeon triangulifer TaxID=2078957 RepID=UPI00286F59F7|nr:uncharacterized protein LOC132200209 [Neocloeon triangulifer]XP_059481469.1 uncharacterized protein LOC132200209 [Neocloeon triangulifer]XP_059481470.1 uncharacterized protein LOC132200209 [Neocloeon triangulifer]
MKHLLICLLFFKFICPWSTEAVGVLTEEEDLEENNGDSGWASFETKFGKLIKRSQLSSSTTEEAWTGRWMPERTSTKKPSTSEEPWTGRWLPEQTTQKFHQAQVAEGGQLKSQFSPNYKEIDLSYLRSDSMGRPDKDCDDGKTNITIDWDQSPINFTCYNPLHRYEPNYKYPAELEEDLIPPAYKAAHLCMDYRIDYSKNIPTYGTHRPLWPRYGEYKFLPKQRWLHNLEHGAVVMLYHPCAHAVEVNRVRKILTGCIRRHIITPYTLMEEDRPIVLVAWGAKLSMSWANADIIRNFISIYAFKAPEGNNARDGQFDHMLEVPAQVISGSDLNDSNICPGQWF